MTSKKPKSLEVPIGLKTTPYFWWFLMNIPPYPSFRRKNQTYPSAQGHCALLQERKNILMEYSKNALQQSTACASIFDEVVSGNDDTKVQFMLDCSVLPSVISAAQKDDNIHALLYRVTRTWCYSLHRTRLKLLGRWAA